MYIERITFSGSTDGTVDTYDLLELMKLSDKVEFGLQANSKDVHIRRWFNDLLEIFKDLLKNPHIAVHVNYDWCKEFCSGKIPKEIKEWMEKENSDGNPLIGRWQLNIGDNTSEFKAGELARIIQDYPKIKFIFPYNIKLQEQIAELNKTGSQFSLLYDSSYGKGISPNSWDGPVYKNHPQGYSGGLCGENVQKNLDMISTVVKNDYGIWIDAEGKLTVPGTRNFSIPHIKDYITQALSWTKSHTRN